MDWSKRKDIWQAVVKRFVTEDVFWENEVAANILTAKVMLLNTAILILSWILNEFGLFDVRHDVLTSVTLQGTVEMVIPALLCLYFRGEKRWLKYLLIIEFSIVLARIDSVLSYNVTLVMIVPVVLTCRYFSGAFTQQIAILSTALFAVSAYCGAKLDLSEYNLMYQAAEKSTYVRNIMLHAFLPKWMIFAMVTVVCTQIAQWGRRMVLEQANISKEHSRVETELDMARRIQERALPIVHTLDDPYLFDLAAIMEPAKEIGGDFYDFFYLDETHLVLMIADVSGKGIPAALFMMVSKLLLDNSITSGKSPGMALAEVNAQLCAKNLENMFVTAWLGILDLETGDMITANAGHEYPLICRKDGCFEIVKDKHGFVLGGMENMRYRETVLHLNPGDILFVYTDGVPEASNAEEEQFGMERTIASLSKWKDKPMAELTKLLKADIEAFVDSAPQFDDTTMLALRMERYMIVDGILTVADEASIEPVEDYVRNTMETAGVPMKASNKINICVDEIYSNIVHYSSATQARVTCVPKADGVTVVFRDNGIPFDPTQNPDPGIAGNAQEREIGGLGLFMVKKLMDSVVYRFDRGENEVTIQYHYG